MSNNLLMYVLKNWKEINGYGKPTSDMTENEMYVIIPMDVLLYQLDMEFKDFSAIKSTFDDY